jgi:hypothetical protein
LLERKKRRE